MSTTQTPLPRPVVLCVMDGVGWGRRDDTDAVFLADTPTLDALIRDCPWGLVKAHGTAVGLPSDGDMGNSEVGHNAMGAGRVFDQGAKLVDQAIASGRIWEGAEWSRIVAAATAPGATLHLLGLLSDGNVHSHVAHLHALVARAQEEGVERLRVHVLTDGRDVSERSALQWITPLEDDLAARSQNGRDYAIATGGGRMHITMDRYEAEWAMVQRGWDCHVRAVGRRFSSATQAVETLYKEDPRVDDQRLPSFVVGDYAGMVDGDAVVLFNFRGDRAIEISRAFDADELPQLDRSERPRLTYAGMMQYDGDLGVPDAYLVSPPAIDGTVAQLLATAGKRCFAVAETQKFGHVTFFFNGNKSDPQPGETWDEVPSPPGPFDTCPEMSARAATAQAVDAIAGGGFDHVRINLANGDMVGHTGDMQATIRAVEVVDACVAELVAATRAAGGVLLLTADHGNADQMVELDKKTGQVVLGADGAPKRRTSHSLNPVPFVVVDDSGTWTTAPAGADGHIGGLAQIGGSLLVCCGVDLPGDWLPALVEHT